MTSNTPRSKAERDEMVAAEWHASDAPKINAALSDERAKVAAKIFAGEMPARSVTEYAVDPTTDEIAPVHSTPSHS